jgi:mono/diheme cytochrome c family protein
MPATDPPAATEAVPTEESTAIPARPTPTAAPTGTELPATEPPPTEAPTATPGPTTAPVDEGRALLEERCTVCHTLDRVERSQKSREEWVSTVARMVENGAQLTDAERAVLIDYLAATYGS